MDVDAAVESVVNGLDALLGSPLWQLSGDHVTRLICARQLAENRAVAVQVAALAEGVSRGLHSEVAAPNGAAWLRGLVPLTPQASVTRAMLAEELPRPDLAPVREAFAAGRMGVGQAGVVARTMTCLDRVPELDGTTWAEAQHLLVGAGQQLDAAQLGRLARKLRIRLSPDGAERLAREEDAMEDLRSAYLVQESTGMWYLRAVLTPSGGATLRAALDPLCAPRPTRELRPDPRSGMQRTADGLVALAELSMAQRPDGPASLPVRHGAATRLVVTGDIETLLTDVARPGAQLGVAPAVVDTGEPVGAEVSPLAFQTMACDAEVVPVLTDGFGRALDVGDSQYRFPRKIRLAIEVRDRHCTFDACMAPPSWCHTHHLVPFGRGGRSGGPTSEANGTLLCGRHHRFVHAGGWIGRLVDGHVVWRPPRADEPLERGAVPARHLERELKRLARRWLARNPDLRDTS